MKSKFYGYLYSRPINGTFIPHKVQNIIIRDYCKNNGIDFPLGNTEVNLDGSWQVLNSLLVEVENHSNLLFYSIETINESHFPLKDLCKIVEEKNLSLHFCVENYIFDSESELLDLFVHTRKENKNIEKNYFKSLHTSTNRDYFERMTSSKPSEMKVSKNFSRDYWDGERKYGYGGYKYDGRWKPLAEKLISDYNLTNKSKLLDLGCGKGFLLYEISCLLPKIEIVGLDISNYAIENSKEEIRDSLHTHDIRDALNYSYGEFDLVISLMTLHNLELPELEFCLSEISRVGKRAYITTESYRNERELTNLQCWALTCESFLSPREWQYLFEKSGYRGDYELLFFE